MKLIPFREDHCSQFIEWIPDETFNFLWGGSTFVWPIDEQQILAHINRIEIESFIALVDDRPVGLIELNLENVENIRLCRVLIASAENRGKGLGRSMLDLAISYVSQTYSNKTLSLRVFKHNASAIHCYRSLGFNIVHSSDKAVIFNNQTWTLITMERAQ